MNATFVQYLSQAKKIWTALPMAPRVTLISFMAGLVLLVAVLGVWSSQGDYVLMMGGLAPEDAAAVSASLKDDKIPFRYEPSRGAIFVPAANADAARLALASKGLPKNAVEGFEIFDKASFGTTEYVQKINHIRALQGTLARSIQALDSVETARVTLSIPDDEIFSREKKQAKASVMVKLRHGRVLEGEQIAAIRHMVASSVPKLEPNGITIVDSSGRMLSRPHGEGDAAGVSDEQLAVQKRIESHFTEKVQSFLDQCLGAGQSAVRITADLNFDRLERSSQKMDPESQVKLEEATRSDDFKGANANASGVPGVASNTPPGNSAGGAGSGAGTSKTQKVVSNRYHYDTVSERVVSQPGSVSRLSVAVLVAPKSTGTGADKKVTPRTPAEIQVLTEVVRSAVGFSAERKDLIKVEELPFNEVAVDPQTVAAAPVPWMELLREHLPNVLAFLGIAVMAFVFYRLLNTQFKPVARLESAREQTTTGTANIESQQPVVVTIQEEVKTLVANNNAQAANLIKGMIR